MDQQPIIQNIPIPMQFLYLDNQPQSMRYSWKQLYILQQQIFQQADKVKHLNQLISINFSMFFLYKYIYLYKLLQIILLLFVRSIQSFQIHQQNQIFQYVQYLLIYLNIQQMFEQEMELMYILNFYVYNDQMVLYFLIYICTLAVIFICYYMKIYRFQKIFKITILPIKCRQKTTFTLASVSYHFRICQTFIYNINNKITYMIDLYAIINEDHTMQTYIRKSKNQLEMQALISHSIKAIKKAQSKVIKSLKVGTYYVYYFRQGTFIFLMATQLTDRIQRMQNYLRVVADIFYQNYDQKKFHYVLDRIMEQINRTEFGLKKNHTLQDQQSSLVQSTVMQQKMKLSSLVQRRNRQSIRAYVIISILFLSIAVLAVIYLRKNWI